MTYDVDRWNVKDDSNGLYPVFVKTPYGEFVFAEDAEAHERAAVEAALGDPWFHPSFVQKQSREQAIRDCIKAVEDLPAYALRDTAITALRALLEGEKP